MRGCRSWKEDGGASDDEPIRCRLGERSPFEEPGACSDGVSLALLSSGSLDRFRPLMALSAVGAPREEEAEGLPVCGILVFSVPSSEMIGVVG